MHTEKDIKVLVNKLLAQIEQEFLQLTQLPIPRLIMIVFEGIITCLRTEYMENP